MAWAVVYFSDATESNQVGLVHTETARGRWRSRQNHYLPRARLTPLSGAFGTTMRHRIVGLAERRVVTVVSRARRAAFDVLLMIKRGRV